MKKITMILMAFVMMTFTQCKPEPDNTNTDTNTNKVRISCKIPINKGDRSDFTDLFEDGVINWSDGRECVYLAIPGDEPKVVELEGYCDGYKPEIEFIAYVDEHLLTAGESYDIWYFGHSQQLDSAYVSLVDGNKIEGSIAKQTGRLEDLGYSHIASTSVTAVIEDGEVKLPLVGTLKNRMAIALLDLENLTTGLFGSAVNTDYTLEYNAETGRYEFNVIEDENASIEAEPAEGISYIAFLPNDNNKVILECDKYGHHYKYVFYNSIKENKIYYRLDTNENMSSLTWDGTGCDYQYVDLGLPSGLKWATCNVGASFPYEGGSRFAWGETETKDQYTQQNSLTYNKTMSDISGNVEYDAARANWESLWRIPTKDEMQELLNNCILETTYFNGVYGYKVVSKINANSIFLPIVGGGNYMNYWSSTPSNRYTASVLSIGTGFCRIETESRYYGLCIRPVTD